MTWIDAMQWVLTGIWGLWPVALLVISLVILVRIVYFIFDLIAETRELGEGYWLLPLILSPPLFGILLAVVTAVYSFEVLYTAVSQW